MRRLGNIDDGEWFAIIVPLRDVDTLVVDGKCDNGLVASEVPIPTDDHFQKNDNSGNKGLDG